ncbi:universal stress protein [Crocosphaera sp. UHCC 0190]|uniref:universal stress protein n=1 Tax=Crocosphaera sp. UHCC 0190 TaxID=3110246 RepID=UPI002B202B67|nr:universal stress protein [Crocosphaera sp. UHCC 0190]MEA5512006.1 universal stress protein [Crocosphaera sp. UHCC 0190]
MSYKKILVALDNSPLGKVVFEQALSMAKQNKAVLMLFHCLSMESQNVTPYASFYEGEFSDFSYLMREQLEQQTESVKQWLTDYCKIATEQGVLTEWDWKIGEPGRWVREVAKSWDADLIVIGRRGLKGITEMFLGSVSNYIVHHSPCSVLVVQGENLEKNC